MVGLDETDQAAKELVMNVARNINRNRMNIRVIASAFTIAVALTAATVRAHDEQDHTDVTCIALSDSSAMFDEPVSAETEASIRSQDTGGQARFQLQGTRWTSTRTHPTIALGEPFFLTYSFVLDGTSIPASFWDTDQNPQASNLFAQMDAQFPGGMTAFRAEIREAFDQWQAVSNFRFVEVPDDGAAFTVNNNGLVPTATQIGRGDIRIAMRTIDDNGVDTDGNGTVDRNVLAYNRYPGNGGDMVLDAGNMATWTNATNDYRRLKNVILHENGHGLGLMHVMPQTSTKLMEPALNTNFDGPQEDDIRAIASLYGDPAESNNSMADAVPVGSIAAGQQTFTDYEMSLERSGAQDWYKFNATGGTELTVTVTPVGTTYQQGAQPTTANPNPPLNTVNAAAIRDLHLTVFNEQGNILDLANATGAGQAETAVVDSLPSTGTYYIRVTSTDNGTQPQRYALNLGAESAPEITVVAQSAPQQNLESGDTFNFGDTTVDSDRHFFFVIDNDGSDTLNLTNNPSIALFGADASDFNINLQPSDISLDPGQSIAFNVGFRPSGTGLHTATILISNDDEDESAFAFTITGNGVASSNPSTGSAEIKVFQVTPQFLFGSVEVEEGGISDFPDVEVGENLPIFYFIENHGDADLVLDGDVVIQTPTSGFSFVGQPNGFPIPPTNNPADHADNFRVRFQPTSTGVKTTRVFIYSNAANTTGAFDFTIRGVGVEPIEDCNSNDVDDADELAGNDCNSNGIPDECDSDSDGDSVPDDCDVCDGEDDLRDTDGDGLADCLDECPSDPFKDEPGNCGCNNEETADCGAIVLCPDGDADFDGVCDSEDVCPGQDDLLDLDGDGIFDCLDNDITPEEPGDNDGDDNTGDDDTGNDDNDDDTGGDAGDNNGGNNGGNDGNDNDDDDGNDGEIGNDNACGTGMGVGVVGAGAFAFGGSRRRRRSSRRTAR